jgi:predicted CopG family antitoxin
MGSRTIGLREDVYERLKARKRKDESFTELVDRQIDETTVDWREAFGNLLEDEVAERERVAAATSEEFADRQE